MKISKDLVAALNRWRADQEQALPPADAIITLLTQTLAAQGYLATSANLAREAGDPLANAFKDFIARTL